MKNCTQCIALQVTKEFRSPGEVRNALKVIQASLAEGTIVESQSWPEGQVKSSNPAFAELSMTGRWDDILEYYFECSACHAVFRFFVETYHGQGGDWQPVKGHTL